MADDSSKITHMTDLTVDGHNDVVNNNTTGYLKYNHTEGHTLRGGDNDFSNTQGAVEFVGNAAVDFIVDIENIAVNLSATNDVSLAVVTTSSLNANEAEAEYTQEVAVGGKPVKEELNAAKKFGQSVG